MTDLVKLIAVCEKAAQEPEKMVLLDPAAVLPIAQGAASALESLSAEIADLRDDVLRLHREKMEYYERNILLLQQRNEAFERAAAKVRDLTKKWATRMGVPTSRARKITASASNLPSAISARNPKP